MKQATILLSLPFLPSVHLSVKIVHLLPVHWDTKWWINIWEKFNLFLNWIVYILLKSKHSVSGTFFNSQDLFYDDVWTIISFYSFIMKNSVKLEFKFARNSSKNRFSIICKWVKIKTIIVRTWSPFEWKNVPEKECLLQQNMHNSIQKQIEFFPNVNSSFGVTADRNQMARSFSQIQNQIWFSPKNFLCLYGIWMSLDLVFFFLRMEKSINSLQNLYIYQLKTPPTANVTSFASHPRRSKSIFLRADEWEKGPIYQVFQNKICIYKSSK